MRVSMVSSAASVARSRIAAIAGTVVVRARDHDGAAASLLEHAETEVRHGGEQLLGVRVLRAVEDLVAPCRTRRRRRSSSP